MEYGFALLKESVTNGSQYCTISGCDIQLSRLNNTSPAGGNEAGSIGIASLNINNSSSASLTITNTSGTHSNNKFVNNVISNVFHGIVVKGFLAPSPYSLYDQSNNIGESGNGNTIQNYGGSGAIAAYGIYTIYQHLDSIINNDIDNLAAGREYCIPIYCTVYFVQRLTMPPLTWQIIRSVLRRGMPIMTLLHFEAVYPVPVKLNS
jgi:hypothetical protein